jgi:D-xylose 1-dehydrogenase (NADP+, D-xylono-1,5-lactone-forming)
MTSVLRWGILGPGRIAPRLVRGIGATSRASLAAVGSRDVGRARAFAAAHHIPRAHGSYEALLGDPEVDVVYVALPNHLHAPWTIRALEAGKHVLCEKPLALAAEEVDAIAEASRRTGRIAA